MKDEEVIRDEARLFFNACINLSDDPSEPIIAFRSVKERLSDFYSEENKAIFLDEIGVRAKKEPENQQESADFLGLGKEYFSSLEANIRTLMFYVKQEVEILPAIARRKSASNSDKKRNKVFISYSHLDKGYLSDIKRHFKPFLSKIDFWDDSKVEPGQKWKDEITQAIAETKTAILLLSTDFLGSEFISNDELPPLLKAAENEGAVILIVILKPCLFEEQHNLNQYQTMNPPSHPVSKMDENEKEDLYVNLVRQVLKITSAIDNE